MMKIGHLWLLLLFFISPLISQQFFQNHPELSWRVYETENFRVYYTQETAWTAKRASLIAEEVFVNISRFYDFKPDKKYDLVLKDVDDYSNGGAYFFNDKVEIWSENLDYPMRGTSHWLYNVLTHELTHMINIQASIKTSKTIPFGFLQIMSYEKEFRKDVIRGFPNVIASYPISSVNFPVWFAEGTAQYQNSWSRHDYRDSHREMVLRDRFVHDRVLSYSSMGVFGKNSIGNESAYNQGFSFVQYLATTYGDSVLEKIVRENSHMGNWTFESAFESAVGIDVEIAYDNWIEERQQFYKNQLSRIKEHLVIGTPLERDGFANLSPRFSPDGNKIAYLTNRQSDYWSQNKLILKDISTGSEIKVADRVASASAFSPDGRYLAYSKTVDDNSAGSMFNDIFIYDIHDDKEYRLTKNLRARHVDWSVNNELVYLISQDGTGYLYRSSFDPSILDGEFSTYYVKIHGGSVHKIYPETDADEWREVEIRFPKAPKLLTNDKPGRQLYHPKWSPDGQMIVYASSNGYGRNIYLTDREGSREFTWLERLADDRDPVFSQDGKRIYFASDSSGVFNIYSRNIRGESPSELHTNVIGGAFMPDNHGGKLTYALYDSLGYNIYYLPEIENHSKNEAEYLTDYNQYIPVVNYTNSGELLSEGKPYRSTFSNFQILPRLFIDYGTIKPGLYVMNSDPLDKWMFFAGAAMNIDLERDINLYIAYNGFKPTIYGQFFNVTQNLEDSVRIIRSDLGRVVTIPQHLNFNLMRADVGMEHTSGALNLKGALIYNKYQATVTNDEVRDLHENIIYEDIPFSYTYLKGPHLALSASWDSRKLDRFTNIAPLGGRYLFLRFSREWNQFLEDFKTSSINIENFNNFYFNRYELVWEEFFRIPGTRYHSLSLKFTGGAVDEPIDQFFNFYAGGLLGMRGYLYYSLGGRYMSVGQISYKFPLFTEIDWEIFNVYFDRLFVNLFADAGDVWTEPEGAQFINIKRDLGIEFRLDLTSFHMFPTRVFFSAAYPLDEFTFYESSRDEYIHYFREPRFYFGILFDFDLRERFGGQQWGVRPLSSH